MWQALCMTADLCLPSCSWLLRLPEQSIVRQRKAEERSGVVVGRCFYRESIDMHLRSAGKNNYPNISQRAFKSFNFRSCGMSV